MNELDLEKQNAGNSSVRLMAAKARVQGLEYSCFLDDHSGASDFPEDFSEHDPAASELELAVNPSFRYQTGNEFPEDVRHLAVPARGFAKHYPIAWVEDAGTRLWMPYWARGAWVDLLEQLRPGAPPPEHLSSAMRHTLVLAGILVSPGYEQRQRDRWDQVCRDAHATFRASSYAIVRGYLPPLHRLALRRYYRAILRAGRIPFGDKLVPTRYALYSEVMGTFIHPQLEPLLSRIAGEPLRPSFNYFVSYDPGSVLPPHTDREPAQFSISLLVDFLPERDGPCGWPLCLKVPGESSPIEADLAVGDFLLYRGRELVHYRDELPAEHRSTSLLFLYVPDGYRGQLW